MVYHLGVCIAGFAHRTANSLSGMWQVWCGGPGEPHSSVPQARGVLRGAEPGVRKRVTGAIPPFMCGLRAAHIGPAEPGARRQLQGAREPHRA